MTAEFRKYRTWLKGHLGDFGDDDVFISYILQILKVDETHEEKKEAIDSILCEVTVDDRDEFVELIINNWNEVEKNVKEEKPTVTTPKLDVNEQLAKILEAQTLQSSSQSRELSEEEKRIKTQILAQYSQTAVTDEEYEEEEEEVPEKTKGSGSGIEKNTNVQDVLQLQKEKREQARLDSAAKKLKDKEDREKQKKLREEKKEKRKTVKGERRR